MKNAVGDKVSMSVNTGTHEVAETTMRQLVQDDLQLKSLSKQQVQMMMLLQCQKRTKIRSFLKTGHKGKVAVFSDQKGLHCGQQPQPLQ